MFGVGPSLLRFIDRRRRGTFDVLDANSAPMAPRVTKRKRRVLPRPQAL